MNPAETRIAFVLPRLTGGGAERSMVNLANEMAGMGFEVDMVLFEKTGVYLDLLHERIRVIDLHTSRALKSVGPLKEYFNIERPQAVLGAMEHVNAAVYLAWKGRKDIRFMPTIRNHLSQEAKLGGLQKRIEFMLAKRAYMKASVVAAVSQGAASDAEETLGLPEGRVKVIYNPVITSDLKSLSQEFPEHPWFHDGGDPVILGVGRLAPQKDFGVLIDAVSMVRESRPARLLILGEGDERAELEAKVQQLNAESWVSLPGFAKNPFSAMSHSAVFVLSSKFEGLPGVLIQAMASGAPVVSTDCPSGPREILAEGKYGALVPVGDSSSLAQAILDTLETPVSAPIEALAPFMPGESVRAYLAALEIGDLSS